MAGASQCGRKCVGSGRAHSGGCKWSRGRPCIAKSASLARPAAAAAAAAQPAPGGGSNLNSAALKWRCCVAKLF
jgi:hypothetical protein